MSHKILDHYTYRVTCSREDGEYLALCAEFLSLSRLAAAPEAALAGIRKVVAQPVADMIANGETLPLCWHWRPPNRASA
jgi:predicted RNase H-like HicB family nuclease